MTFDHPKVKCTRETADQPPFARVQGLRNDKLSKMHYEMHIAHHTHTDSVLPPPTHASSTLTHSTARAAGHCGRVCFHVDRNFMTFWKICFSPPSAAIGLISLFLVPYSFLRPSVDSFQLGIEDIVDRKWSTCFNFRLTFNDSRLESV